MKNLTYRNFPDSQYIILSDGTVARRLKPMKIGRQFYFNLLINKKMKRYNKEDLMAEFNAPEENQRPA